MTDWAHAKAYIADQGTTPLKEKLALNVGAGEPSTISVPTLSQSGSRLPLRSTLAGRRQTLGLGGAWTARGSRHPGLAAAPGGRRSSGRQAGRVASRKPRRSVASESIQPGEHWSSEILANLRASAWVIVLASREACQSAFVNQEIGGAVLATKQVIPIIWDMRSEELPGWARGLQAIKLEGSKMVQLGSHIGRIPARIKHKKLIAAMINCRLDSGRCLAFKSQRMILGLGTKL